MRRGQAGSLPARTVSAATRAIIEAIPARSTGWPALCIRFDPPRRRGDADRRGRCQPIIPLEGIIDIAAEKARLAKALEASTKETKSLEGRLSNPSFVEKAKPEAVDKARADHAMHAAEAERLAAALARLG